MITELKKVTRKEYDKVEALNASTIVPGCKSMLHMRHYLECGKPETPAMRTGRLQHVALLEPDLLGEKTVTWKGGLDAKGKLTMSKNSTAYKEFVAAHQDGEIIIVDQTELDGLETLRDRVYAHKDAASLLEGARKELGCFWDSPHGPCKALIDAYKPGLIIDPKTTGDIDPHNFERIAARLNYHVRMGWYQVGVREVENTLPKVVIICIEQNPPHDIVIYEYSEMALAHGRDIALAVAEKYAECKAKGYWPGVAASRKVLALPSWMTNEIERRAEAEAALNLDEIKGEDL